MDERLALGSDVIVVNEDRRVVHGFYGFFLLVVLVGTWAILAFVEQPADVASQNRIALLVVAGLASAALIARWIYEARYPARLEVTRDRISAKRRGRAKETILTRTTGELKFGVESMVIAGRGTVTPVLAIPDSDQEALGIAGYDGPKIRQACEALGWHFVD